MLVDSNSFEATTLTGNALEIISVGVWPLIILGSERSIALPETSRAHDRMRSFTSPRLRPADIGSDASQGKCAEAGRFSFPHGRFMASSPEQRSATTWFPNESC